MKYLSIFIVLLISLSSMSAVVANTPISSNPTGLETEIINLNSYMWFSGSSDYDVIDVNYDPEYFELIRENSSIGLKALKVGNTTLTLRTKSKSDGGIRNNLYTIKIEKGNESSQTSGKQSDNTNISKRGGAYINVWVYGWFWNWWKWVYGDWWSWAPGKDGSVYIHHAASWHQVYGSFNINYWHIESKYCSGTVPSNAASQWTPNPTYDNLHYQGQP